jgi:predicted MFS family arabinose efflux permease
MAVTRDKEHSGAKRGTRNLGSLARFPVQYFRRIPAPLRVLMAGILVNRAGGFVIVFLALILAVRHVATTEIGIALILSGTFAVAGSWLGGALIPRLGIRRTIFLSMAGSALFTAALAAPSPFPITAGIVCLIALFGRAYPPAGATLVGRVSSPEQRIQMFAFYQLALNFGASIGPAIAGYLLTHSLTGLLLTDAATSAVFAVLGLRIPADAQLPGQPGELIRRPSCASQPGAAQSEATESGAGQPEAGRKGAGPRPARVRNDRHFLMFLVAVALICVVFSQSNGPLLLLFRKQHYSYAVLGDLLTAHAIAVLLFQLPLSYLTRRQPVWIPLALSAVLICGAYPLLLAGTSLPLIAVNVALWTVGDIIFCPVCMAVASLMSTPRTQGSYQGAHSVARSVGLAIGPSAGVFAFSVNPALPWLGCGVLGIVTVGLYYAGLRRVPRPYEPAPSDPGGA